jgi:hypothetical protein
VGTPGLVAAGGPVRLGVLPMAGSGPVALGGGTLSPPTGAELLTALAVAAGVEAGAPGPEGPPAPQAATRRLVSTPATAVARLAGIRLLRCFPAVP